MQVYLVAALLFVLAISVFALQNSQPVTLKFLNWELPSFPLVLVITFSAATGVLATLLFSIARQFKLNLQIRELQSRLKQLEKKLGEQQSPGPAGNNSSRDNQPSPNP